MALEQVVGVVAQQFDAPGSLDDVRRGITKARTKHVFGGFNVGQQRIQNWHRVEQAAADAESIASKKGR